MVLVSKIEEGAVVATAEPETNERRLELLYVTDAAGLVAIHAVFVENSFSASE